MIGYSLRKSNRVSKQTGNFTLLQTVWFARTLEKSKLQSLFDFYFIIHIELATQNAS